MFAVLSFHKPVTRSLAFNGFSLRIFQSLDDPWLILVGFLHFGHPVGIVPSPVRQRGFPRPRGQLRSLRGAALRGLGAACGGQIAGARSKRPGGASELPYAKTVWMMDQWWVKHRSFKCFFLRIYGIAWSSIDNKLMFLYNGFRSYSGGLIEFNWGICWWTNGLTSNNISPINIMGLTIDGLILITNFH